MRLGLVVGYWGSAKDAGTGEQVALVRQAEESGYAVAWVAEAYGSDAPTVLAWLGAHTSRIDLGAGIMQIPARTPAMTAMTAATLDTLTQGRFRLGLGVSGPQVSEGWHGVRFEDPLGRTREYVAIVRSALRRDRLSYDGRHFTLPLPDGPGKALRLTTRPVREHVPIYLAAIGPRNLRLAGEIADGWLPVFYIPEEAPTLHEQIAGARGGNLDGFDVAPSVPVSLGEDLDAAYDRVRPYAALYVGGMGSAQQNFYNRIARRAGFEQEAERVQELYLAGRPREAAAALSPEFLDRTALIGPPGRVAERLHEYARAGVTTLGVAPYADSPQGRLETVRTMAELVDREGLG